MDIVSIIVTLLVIAISLIIVSKVPFLGVEIATFPIALISAVVFAILNAIGEFLTPGIPITLGLLSFVINVIVFGLSAKLVEGFRLKYGVWSAIMGALVMAIVLGIVKALLAQVGVAA
ncbi:MAG: phage holin family protein [Leptolyngbyaceae bacterium]|nr:phage holin family protein [Leptolyngbyaceae bacterium]